jgi:hypothetical protein
LKVKSKSLSLKDNTYFDEMEAFFNVVSIPELSIASELPDFMYNSHKIKDHEVVRQLRSQCHTEFNPLIDILSKTSIYNISQRYSLFAKELFMLGSFMGRKGQVYIFSTGLKNIFCIALGQSLKRMTDPGVVFCFAGYIPKTIIPHENLFSPIYGDVSYYESGDNTFFVSSWRRLKKTKLAFMSDVFYSTLSSACIDLIKVPFKKITVEHIKEFYTIRNIIGLNSSQKNAEMLLDFKYLALGSLSKYANLRDLLPDKFGPIYSNHFSIWLVHVFWNYCKNIIVQKSSGQPFVTLTTPVFSEDMRTTESVGGILDIPGFWAPSLQLDSFEHFLSSLHSYVHSPKEPNSMFFENIKCLNTILKFKNLYDNSSFEKKWGYSSILELKELFKSEFGFSSTFLYNATMSFFNSNQIDYTKILNQDIFRKPIAHFTSTKASILSYDRDVDKYDRLKVHDALILREDINHMTLLELCQWTLESKHVPLVDMCIKEQYGAKREFYVVDIESKFLCKALEEYFKVICKGIETECISVPGDLKLIKMQKNVNKILRHAYTFKQNVYFINGDCSKWSASEMLESFQTVLYAHKEKMPVFLYKIFMHIFESWKSKELQIPRDIRDKINILTEHTDYLFEKGEKVYRIKLEQNFLMGIFNYFSSYKASIINSYIKGIIETYMPNTELYHLEHSDDYLWSISCKPSQIAWIKTKICKMMKLGSITDSKKKTTVSTFYCEFVSLFSFNGHMMYPTIKKTKEISSALTGEGFQSDMLAVCSRTSELVRTGCTMTESLIFHKIHCWQLANLYSLLPGQRNFDKNYYLFDKPIEFFGLSEVHPLLYFINNGDVNNLRLFKYNKEAIPMLQVLAVEKKKEFEEDTLTSLSKPKFHYVYTGRKLNKVMKQLSISHDENISFLNLHPVLQYYKPLSKDLIMPYLKSFYSLKSFQKAYEQSGRFQILLRIAYYTSKHCLSYAENFEHNVTIRKFISEIPLIIKNSNAGYVKEEFLTNGDTSGLIFYGLLKACTHKRDIFTQPIKRKLVANHSPFMYNAVKVDTPAAILLLKKYDEGLYIKENIRYTRKWDIDNDMKVVDKLDYYFSDYTIQERINIIYKQLTSPLKPVRAMMVPFSDRRELLDFIRTMLREQTSAFCRVYLNQVTDLIFANPLNTTFRSFFFKNKEIPLERALALTILSIYAMLKFKPPYYKSNVIQSYFDKMETTLGQSAFDFIDKLSPQEMQYFQMSRSEISSMIIVKMDIATNLDHLKEYFSMFSSFTYRYVLTGTNIQGKWVGNTIANFVVNKCQSKIHWIENYKKFMLVVNKNNPILCHQALVTGMYLIQKVKQADMKYVDPNVLLDEVVLDFKSAQFLIKEYLFYYRKNKELTNIIDKTQIMVTDFLGTNRFVSMTAYKDTTAKYYPIFYCPKFKILTKGETETMFNDCDFDISTETGVLMTKPGNWVVSKFGFSDFWTEPLVITNLSDFTLSGVKLTYLLNDMRLDKIVNKEKNYFKIDEVDEQFIRKEMMNQETRTIDAEQFVRSFERGKEIQSIIQTNETQDISQDEDLIPGGMSILKGDIDKKEFSLLGDFTKAEMFAKVGAFNPLDFKDLKFDMSSGSGTSGSEMNWMKTSESSMSFQSESESDTDDMEYSKLELNIKDVEEPQAILFKSEAHSHRNYFLNRISPNYIWEDILLAIVDSMLIHDYHISKMTYFLVLIMELKYPEFLKQIKDTVYQFTMNQILIKMEKCSVWNLPEYFPHFSIALRLNFKDNISKLRPFLLKEGHSIVILGYKTGYLKIKDLKRVENDPNLKIIYSGYRDAVGQTVIIEKNLDEDEFKNLIEKMIGFYQNAPIHNNKTYDPLLYILCNSKFEIVDQDVFRKWF